MFRFKLRTLLIATALICVFLGLQVHVHRKAQRLVEEMREPSQETIDRLIKASNRKGVSNLIYRPQPSVIQEPLAVTDVVFIQRRCKVEFKTVVLGEQDRGVKRHVHIYRLNVLSEKCETSQEWSSID